MNKVVPMRRSLAISQETVDQVMREIGSPRKRKRKTAPQTGKWIGCTWEFFQAATCAANGKAALALALMIYRRCKVRENRTITLPPGELADLNIPRNTCRQALRQLQTARLIRLHSIAPGHKARITLLWPPRAV